jgi:hypothetical protein
MEQKNWRPISISYDIAVRFLTLGGGETFRDR